MICDWGTFKTWLFHIYISKSRKLLPGTGSYIKQDLDQDPLDPKRRFSISCRLNSVQDLSINIGGVLGILMFCVCQLVLVNGDVQIRNVKNSRLFWRESDSKVMCLEGFRRAFFFAEGSSVCTEKILQSALVQNLFFKSSFTAREDV